MGTYQNHMKLYRHFKDDAENEDNHKASRAELYFLSAFHLIEACAAKGRVHINKHQKIRVILENNSSIFENKTEIIWRASQNIENKLRPKFTYGFSWDDKDFAVLTDEYRKIEQICLDNLEV